MPTSPSPLTLIRGLSEAWPLQATATDGSDAVGVFSGAETLAVELFYGADAALAVVPTAAWISGPSGQYILAVSAAQSAALAPGNYTVVVHADSPSLGEDPLLEATLVVEPAPTDGSGLLRALAQPSDLAALVPSQAANPGVPAALASATRAIEAYCRRTLILTDFDRCHRPGRTRRIYLDAWPVQGEPVLSYNLATAAVIVNTDATGNQQAAVSMAPAASGSGQPATLTLRRTASGIVTTNAFVLSDYATINDLLTAIGGVGGGWQVVNVSPGNSSPTSANIALLPTSRLNFQMGRFGALNQRVELRCYATEVNDYAVDPQTGEVELTEGRPEAFRYADRAYGSGYGYGWGAAGQPLQANVRCQFRGGYAIAQADLALGYDPVPADLKHACCLTAQSILMGGSVIGPVKSQTAGNRSYTLKDATKLVPDEVKPLLTGHVSYRFGGWGR